MNTANALGYLVGAVVTGAVTRRWGSRHAFAVGMAATAVALLLAAVTPGFALQLVLRLVAGIGSAFTFIAGSALTASVASRRPDRAGTFIAVYAAGAGIGVLLSALTVQPVLAATGPTGWPWAWAVLGGLAVAATVLALPALRRTDTAAGSTDGAEVAGRVSVLRDPRTRLPALGYLLFGAGYIAYITFVVADLRDGGASVAATTWFWAVLGLTVCVGIPVWGGLLDRLPTRFCLASMCAVLVAGTVVLLASDGVVAGLVSAVVFGSTFMTIPAGMTALARRELPPPQWSAAIAQLTVAFAVGQSIGPVLGGVLADRAGGPHLGLTLAAVVLAGSGAAYLLSGVRAAQRAPEPS